jgi:O-antigen ligase
MTERPPRAFAASVRTFAACSLILVAGSLQFSIFVSQVLLAVTVAAWLAVLVVEKHGPAAPRFAIPLALYAGMTILSAALSFDPRASLADCKQLVLLLIVPITYELMNERLAWPAATVVLSAGAVSGLVGIAQYGLLNYDNLGLRPRSTLGMYMTFSGLTMLVVGLAVSQVLFARKQRTWPALIVPALSVALAVTFTRSAWVGAFGALALLLVLKDFRLIAVLPLIAAVFLIAAPPGVVQRFYSIFDLTDPTNRDRLAMLRAGEQIVRAHPLTGVGPDMVERAYPAYRVPDAVMETTPHLHSVPLQIAAERGLPALGLWVWFIAVLTLDLWRLFRFGSTGAGAPPPAQNDADASPRVPKARGDAWPQALRERWLPAAGLASVVAMLAAGLFEYNFGDSEFLMLFLFLITLPFAAERRPS